MCLVVLGAWKMYTKTTCSKFPVFSFVCHFSPFCLFLFPDSVSWGSVHHIETMEHQTRPWGCGGRLQNQPGPPRPPLLGPLPYALANGLSVSSCALWTSSTLITVKAHLMRFLCVCAFQTGEGADASQWRWKYLLLRHTLQRHLGSNGGPGGQRSG